MFNLRNEFDNYRKLHPVQQFSNQSFNNNIGDLMRAENSLLKGYLAQSFAELKDLQSRQTADMDQVLKMLNYQSEKICTLSAKAS